MVIEGGARLSNGAGGGGGSSGGGSGRRRRLGASIRPAVVRPILTVTPGRSAAPLPALQRQAEAVRGPSGAEASVGRRHLTADWMNAAAAAREQ